MLMLGAGPVLPDFFVPLSVFFLLWPHEATLLLLAKKQIPDCFFGSLILPFLIEALDLPVALALPVQPNGRISPLCAGHILPGRPLPDGPDLPAPGPLFFLHWFVPYFSAAWQTALQNAFLAVHQCQCFAIFPPKKYDAA